MGQRHHYIPKFYLRKWLGSDFKLEEFARVPPSNQIRSRRRGVDSTGYAEDLYTMPGVTDQTKQNIERLFMGVVDSRAAEARNMLLAGTIPQGELRLAWARFILTMLMRSPEEISRFKSEFTRQWAVSDPELQSEYEKQRRPEWPDQLEDYARSVDPTITERQALLVATQLMQNKNVIQLLMKAEWWVLDTSSVKRALMTSDHPVVMTNGLGRPDGHFGIPIGPRHLFVAFMQREFSASFRRLPVGKIVRLTNEAVIGQARRSVYGLDAANIAEVRRLMGKRDYFTALPSKIAD